MAKIGDVEGILRLRDEFTGVLTRAQSQLQAAGQQMMAIGAGMSQVGGTLTRNVTLPLIAIGGVAIKTFSDFDGAMTQSMAIMGDLSDTMKADLANTALEVAKVTTFSAKEAADSFFFLASAGLDAATSIEALPTVATFAQAGMFDMATATDLLTDAQSALGLTVRDTETGIVDVTATMENMARVGDVLVKANTLANATVEQFSTALTREAGSALKSFKIDVEEGVAVLAAFADQGIKGEIAGTGLSRILRLMTSAAVKNKEAYKDLNVEVFDLATGNINNLADIIGDLEEAFKDLSDEERVEALTLLGFRARVQGVILPLIGTSGAIRRFDAALRDSGGTMREIADKQLESFRVKMGLLKDQFIDVAIALGAQITAALETLIPTLVRVAEVLKKGVEIFGRMPTAVKLAAVAAVGLVAALGPLLVIGGSLLTMFASLVIIFGSGMGAAAVATAGASITGVFGSILGVLGGAGGLLGVLGGVVTFLTGPVGIAIAIGIALVAFKPFRDVVFELGGLIVNMIKIALIPFVAIFKVMKSLIGPMIGAIGELAGAALGALGKALGWVATKISEANESWDEWLNQTNQKAFEAASKGADELASSAQGMIDIFDKFGKESLKQWLENLDQSVISVDDLKAGLGILGSAGKVTGEDFEFLRLALVAASDAAAGAEGPTDDFLAALAALDEEANETKETLTKLDKAIQDLGFVTAKDVTGEMDGLRLAFESGIVPIGQLETKVEELRKKYKELELLTPELAKELDGMTEALKRQETATEQLLVDIPAAKNAMDLMRGAAGQLPPVLKASTEGLREVDEQAQDTTVSFGEFFQGIQTGIPVVDGFLGKLKGFLGIFTSITSALSGVSKGFGSFFGKIAGALGGGGGGGGGIPGLGGIDKLIGSFTSMFSGAAAALPGVITTTLAPAIGTGVSAAFTVGLPAAVPALTSAGASAGTAVGGGMVSSFGGMMSSLVPLMTNPITIGVAAAIAGFFVIKKLFFKSREEVRGTRQEGIFGAFTVPQTVLDGLVKLSVAATKAGRSLPDTIASLVGFKDVLTAVGIQTLPQFMFAMNKGDEAVGRMREGLITGTEAANFFGGESLRIMKEAAIALGGTAVAEFDNMIRKAVEAGIIIPKEFKKAFEVAAGSADQVSEALVKVGDEITIQIPKMFGGTKDVITTVTQEMIDAMKKTAAEINLTTTKVGDTMMAQVAIVGGGTKEMSVIVTQGMLDMAEAAQSVTSGVADAAQEAADRIVVTEAEKEEAIKVIAELGLQSAIRRLDEQQKAQLEAAALTVKTWEEATGKQVDILDQATSTMGGAVSKLASIFTGTLADSASTGADAVSESMARMAESASATFDRVSEASRRAARESIEAWEEWEEDMVGESIIPDTVNQSVTWIHKMGDASEDEAKRMTDAFSDGVGDGRGTVQPGSFTSSLTGLTPSIATPAGIGGGVRQPIQLVVEGQVLATVMIKNMPRALANAGVANSQR